MDPSAFLPGWLPFPKFNWFNSNKQTHPRCAQGWVTERRLRMNKQTFLWERKTFLWVDFHKTKLYPLWMNMNTNFNFGQLHILNVSGRLLSFYSWPFSCLIAVIRFIFNDTDCMMYIWFGSQAKIFLSSKIPWPSRFAAFGIIEITRCSRGQDSFVTAIDILLS